MAASVVDFDAMREAIAGYTANVKHIESIEQSLEAIATTLGVANIFSGGAATTFLTTVSTTIKALNEAMMALNAIIQGLQGQLDQYEATDQAAKSIASAIEMESHVIQPPAYADVRPR